MFLFSSHDSFPNEHNNRGYAVCPTVAAGPRFPCTLVDLQLSCLFQDFSFGHLRHRDLGNFQHLTQRRAIQKFSTQRIRNCHWMSHDCRSKKGHVQLTLIVDFWLTLGQPNVTNRLLPHQPVNKLIHADDRPYYQKGNSGSISRGIDPSRSNHLLRMLLEAWFKLVLVAVYWTTPLSYSNKMIGSLGYDLQWCSGHHTKFSGIHIFPCMSRYRSFR